MDDMEYCSIIDAICPYEHGCAWCRLHNDYEDARAKARRIEEEMGWRPESGTGCTGAT